MTKITLSDSRVYGWSSQDIIAVSVNQGGSYSFVESTAYSDSKFAVTHGRTRTGYAVLPSSFAKSYNGSTLTVTYPESYDISADISAGRYDNVNGSAYIPFPMVVLFPDGYVDQTDFINTTPSGAKADSYFPISYDAYVQMVSAGAIFLPVAGYFGHTAAKPDDPNIWRDLPSYGGYWLSESQSATAGSSLRIAGASPWVHINNDFLRTNYRPVRLVRAVAIP